MFKLLQKNGTRRPREPLYVDEERTGFPQWFDGEVVLPVEKSGDGEAKNLLLARQLNLLPGSTIPTAGSYAFSPSVGILNRRLRSSPGAALPRPSTT